MAGLSMGGKNRDKQSLNPGRDQECVRILIPLFILFESVCEVLNGKSRLGVQVNGGAGTAFNRLTFRSRSN